MAATSAPTLSPAFSTAQELIGRIDTMQATSKLLQTTAVTIVKKYDAENSEWDTEGFPLPYKGVKNNYKHCKQQTRPLINKINECAKNLTKLEENIKKASNDLTNLLKHKKTTDELNKRKTEDEEVNPEAACALHESYIQINKSIHAIEKKLKEIDLTIAAVKERLTHTSTHPHSKRLTQLGMIQRGEARPPILESIGARVWRYVPPLSNSVTFTVEELSDDSDIDEELSSIQSVYDSQDPNDPLLLDSKIQNFSQDIPCPSTPTSQRTTPPSAPRTPSPSTQSASAFQDTVCASSLSLTSLPEPSSSPLPPTHFSAQDLPYPSLSSSPDTPVSSSTSIQDPAPPLATTPSPTPDVPPIPDVLLAILGNGNHSS